jgi:pimeloyl-ACP methyl ester carboxylesterase
MYLGWSMGGAAAQIIAINHPDSVDKLLLLATGPPGNPDFDPANPEFGSRARKPVYEFDDYQFLFFYKSETAKAACASCLKRVNLIQDKDVAVTPEGYNNMTAAKSVGSSSTGTTSKRPPPNPALAGIE